MIEDVKFKTYNKIKHLGDEDNKGIFDNPEDELAIQEKVDGANCRFMRKGDRLIFGSHNCSIGDSTTEIGGNWKNWTNYINDKFKKYKSEFFEGVIYFGEAFLKHSISYDWENVPPFIGFDVYDFEKGEYLHDHDAKYMFEHFDVDFVPTIWEGHVKDVPNINDDLVPKSKFGDVQAEGIVIKNVTKGIYAKYVRSAFKEINKKAFGGRKKDAEDDTERFVAMFCTNPRIDKFIFKLIDEGNKLELAMMNKLPKIVYDDIIEENWHEICHSKYTINFRQFNKSITSRCLAVLKQVIVNNTLNGDKNDE